MVMDGATTTEGRYQMVQAFPACPVEYHVVRKNPAGVEAFAIQVDGIEIPLGPSTAPVPFEIGSDDLNGNTGMGELALARAILFDLLRNHDAVSCHGGAFARHFLMPTKLDVGFTAKFSVEDIHNWINSRYADTGA